MASGPPIGTVFNVTGHILDELPPSERAVAQLVLEHPREAVYLSVQALAERAQVSTTSVLRYCQKVGFEGFKDFKLALAAELGRPVAILPEKVSARDSAAVIGQKVMRANLQALERSLDLVSDVLLERAVAALAEAERIVTCGAGTSAPIALDACYRLLRLGLEASYFADPQMQAVNVTQLTPNDLVLAVSHTGRSAETLAAVRLAQKRGATVIGLTSSLASPLAAEADIGLVTVSNEIDFQVEAMSSRVAHLSIIDTLYLALTIRRLDETTQALERAEQAIDLSIVKD